MFWLTQRGTNLDWPLKPTDVQQFQTNGWNIALDVETYNLNPKVIMFLSQDEAKVRAKHAVWQREYMVDKWFKEGGAGELAKFETRMINFKDKWLMTQNFYITTVGQKANAKITVSQLGSILLGEEEASAEHIVNAGDRLRLSLDGTPTPIRSNTWIRDAEQPLVQLVIGDLYKMNVDGLVDTLDYMHDLALEIPNAVDMLILEYHKTGHARMSNFLQGVLHYLSRTSKEELHKAIHGGDR